MSGRDWGGEVAGGQVRQGFDSHGDVVSVAVLSGFHQRAEQVEPGQERRDGAWSRDDLAGAHHVQRALQAVRQVARLFQAEEPGPALDGVGGPEHGVHHVRVGIRSGLLHVQQVLLDSGQVLACVIDEASQDVVVGFHVRP